MLEDSIIPLEYEGEQRNLVVRGGTPADFLNALAEPHGSGSSHWHQVPANVVHMHPDMGKGDVVYATMHPLLLGRSLGSLLGRGIGTLMKYVTGPGYISDEIADQLVEEDRLTCGTRTTYFDPTFLPGELSRKSQGFEGIEGTPRLEDMQEFSYHPLVGECSENATRCHALSRGSFYTITYLCEEHHASCEPQRLGTREHPLYYEWKGEWWPFSVDEDSMQKRFSATVFPSKIRVIDDIARLGLPGARKIPLYLGSFTNADAGYPEYEEEFMTVCDENRPYRFLSGEIN